MNNKIGQYNLLEPTNLELIANDLIEKLKDQFASIFEYDIDYLVGGTLRMAECFIDGSATKRDIDLIVSEKTLDEIRNSKVYHEVNYFGGVRLHKHSRKTNDLIKIAHHYLPIEPTKFDMFSLGNFAKNIFKENATIDDYVNGTTYNIEGLAWNIKEKRLHVSEKYSTKTLIRQSTFGDTSITKNRGRSYRHIYGLMPDEKTRSFLEHQEPNKNESIQEFVL